MRAAYPTFIFVRVDRPLRAALDRRAAASGLTVSELARRELRAGLDRDRPDDPPPSAPAVALRPAA